VVLTFEQKPKLTAQNKGNGGNGTNLKGKMSQLHTKLHTQQWKKSRACVESLNRHGRLCVERVGKNNILLLSGPVSKCVCASWTDKKIFASFCLVGMNMCLCKKKLIGSTCKHVV
jgi:hypothetical protein